MRTDLDHLHLDSNPRSVQLIAHWGQIRLIAVTVQRDLLTYGMLTDFAWPPAVSLDGGTALKPAGGPAEGPAQS